MNFIFKFCTQVIVNFTFFVAFSFDQLLRSDAKNWKVFILKIVLYSQVLHIG
jgi:hypothetical protein